MTRNYEQGPILSRMVPQCIVLVQIGVKYFLPLRHGMVDVCDEYLAAKAPGSSFG